MVLPTNLIKTSTSLTTFIQWLPPVVYFKGQWKNKFYPERTQETSFYVTSEKTVSAPMMHVEIKVRYADIDDLQILELPYIGDEMAMLVILPKERDGLKQIEEILSVENLSQWQAKMKKKPINIFLPKFKTTYKITLNQTLVTMGMIDAFSSSKADFSGMTGNSNDLFISDAVHKAFVEVNEEGTEASAATAVDISWGDDNEEMFTFRADHPFLFLIWHKETHSILFMGRLNDPTRNDPNNPVDNSSNQR